MPIRTYTVSDGDPAHWDTVLESLEAALADPAAAEHHPTLQPLYDDIRAEAGWTDTSTNIPWGLTYTVDTRTVRDLRAAYRDLTSKGSGFSDARKEMINEAFSVIVRV